MLGRGSENQGQGRGPCGRGQARGRGVSLGGLQLGNRQNRTTDDEVSCQINPDKPAGWRRDIRRKNNTEK